MFDNCEWCGAEYEMATGRSRYCSRLCYQRAANNQTKIDLALARIQNAHNLLARLEVSLLLDVIEKTLKQKTKPKGKTR